MNPTFKSTIFLKIFFLASFIFLVNSQTVLNDTVSQNKDPYYPSIFLDIANFRALKSKTKYAKGDNALVNLNVYSSIDNPDWKQGVFVPRVDEFTILEVEGSGAAYTMKNDGTRDIWISLSFGYNQTESPNRYFIKKSNLETNRFNAGRFVGSYSAIIQLNRGVIDQIFWDDGCGECTDADCFDGYNCTIDMNANANNCTNISDCNIKVYVVWSGTDANGYNMASISSLPSRFSAFSLKKVYLTTSGVVNTRY
eukprot:TRINITY_DN229_c0_g1_i5.p1 TRINITY_DN229_c0_g1~~TRINITY_DN229_c0_g1_i5.p1  ORF type:complete len:253 (-),score=61.15 TRINITY_DN229_c0_g1_i5:193-951(-)